MTLIAIIQRRLRQHRIIPVEVASPAATAAEVKERSFGGAPIDGYMYVEDEYVICVVTLQRDFTYKNLK